MLHLTLSRARVINLQRACTARVTVQLQSQLTQDNLSQQRTPQQSTQDMLSQLRPIPQDGTLANRHKISCTSKDHLVDALMVARDVTVPLRTLYRYSSFISHEILANWRKISCPSKEYFTTMVFKLQNPRQRFFIQPERRSIHLLI